MSDDLITIGDLEATYRANGSPTGVRIEVWHNGLNEHRLIRAPDQIILRNKLAVQLEAWRTKWQKVSSERARTLDKLRSKGAADEKTREAEAALAEARGIISAALTCTTCLDFNKLKDYSDFVFKEERKYPSIIFENKSRRPLSPEQVELPIEPLLSDFETKTPFFARFIPSIKKSHRKRICTAFQEAHKSWKEAYDSAMNRQHELNLRFKSALQHYFNLNNDFSKEQSEYNKRIDIFKESYNKKETDSVSAALELLISNIPLPEWIPKTFICTFVPESRTAVIDFTLPSKEKIPSLVKVTYVASKEEMRHTNLKPTEINALFDAIAYQLALSILHLVFRDDTANAIESAVFNGWLTWINAGTGAEETGCLLSLHTTKVDMAKIDLARVDPKACFKQLKGVSAAKLSGITPIPPIMKINRDDERFIQSHEVINQLDSGVNLASIEWEEFEHLVRELFEREFSKGGGEVKVTRASADGGVDAVVFDPDPIRGGKIVIQAKRYTATVGVSAVRDLYGTMLNEGAMKGILVTTADYGADSYAFAKDKPITLLNGGNLLSLLEKHGQAARIDLAEARRLRLENQLS